MVFEEHPTCPQAHGWEVTETHDFNFPHGHNMLGGMKNDRYYKTMSSTR